MLKLNASYRKILSRHNPALEKAPDLAPRPLNPFPISHARNFSQPAIAYRRLSKFEDSFRDTDTHFRYKSSVNNMKESVTEL